ncbi:MAG: hypothetical protein C7B47_10810 [Sulfobacillus thermosulfidooxidans]|uniref:Uncharacterized protein n=1 Tax=Sulfobacillus thermosulfidooxidans TaxID=28034 RepID=A0A2T2WVW9_SULTH|nr:MAG: hypothetical protein C7B47_10810 [Sulfobacillus thermosulfidooxidans]
MNDKIRYLKRNHFHPVFSCNPLHSDSAQKSTFSHFFFATLGLGLILKWALPSHPLELLTDLSFWIYSLLR